MLNNLFWIVPACAVIALLFARIFFKGMMKESEGTDTMKRIAGHVRKGAMAYLRQQYRIVAMVFLVLCILFAWMAYGPGLQNPWVWFAFLTGGFFSGLAGYIGMKTATYASARTANAARRSLNDGLKNFKESIIFASHDHEFIQTLANHIIVLSKNGVIDRIDETYDEFLENAEVQAKVKELWKD